MSSDFAQNGALGGQSVNFESGIDEKVVLTFEIVRAVELDIGVLVQEIVDKMVVDGLSLLLKNSHVLMLSPLFSGAKQ
jgi:hypothetical protein